MPRRRKEEPNGAPETQAEGKGESIAGYFRQVFAQQPRLLKERSNAELLRRWQDDHPGQELTPSVKNSMMNIKSVLRKQGRKRGRKPKAAAAATAVTPAAAPAPRPVRNLEA